MRVYPDCDRAYVAEMDKIQALWKAEEIANLTESFSRFKHNLRYRMDKRDIHTKCLEYIPPNKLCTTLLLSYLQALWHFQLLLHNPVEMPKIADFGSLLAPGRVYRITITPNFNNSTRSLRYMKEADRKCAYSADRYLRFYRTYTQKHCNLECEANFTYSVCSCVPFYLPSTCAQILYPSFFSSFHFSASSFFRFYLSLPSFRLLPFRFSSPFLEAS